MKVVDNFDFFEKSGVLQFVPGEFYFVQVLVRGKDGHKVRGNNKNRLIKFYTIDSVERLHQYEPEIKQLCELFNARAYIHLTPRSYSDVANEMLRIVVETFTSQNNIGLKGSYSTACGRSYIPSKKLYVVDIDDEDVDRVDEIESFIDSQCRPVLQESKVVFRVPTASGVHLICKPFDVQMFNKNYQITVHKNNPTLLYFIKHE